MSAGQFYGYVAFYKGQRWELRAASTRQAQTIAAVHFGAPRPRDVSVMLAEEPDGKPVVHKPEGLA
jgi:hypothetical protein